MKFLVINGPNMNLLGIREPDIYGKRTYSDLIEFIYEHCKSTGVDVEFFQSNHEGAIVDKIQDAYSNTDAIIINAAAYTHTSVAIADAIKAVGIPTAEVHISNPDLREEYRKISYLRSSCIFTISGKGFDGYNEAIDRMAAILKR